jgi:hypothetical protein
MFINLHECNIKDSKLANMIHSSCQFKNESNFSQNDATINPLERNIESTNNTALVNDANSQSMTHQNNSGLGNLKKAKKNRFLLEFF